MDFQGWKTRFEGLDTACLCDVNKSVRVMDVRIRPLNPGKKLIGRAHTVRCHEDFLTVIKALDEAKEDDVLVIEAGDAQVALAGEMFAMEALQRGLGGIIIDGGCRDTQQIQKIPLPVYARFITPMAGTASQIFKTQTEIQCGGVPVRPGDIVFGDDDGIVVMTEKEMKDIIEAAQAVQKTEEQIFSRMEQGQSLLEMLNFSEHCEKISRNRPSQLTFKT
jgi:RraA family protein